jgi:two-component system NtrC family sensor kinase
VDAVVCDLRMPGMDGHAFHDQLRAERPGLAARTVFVTGDVVSSEAREIVLRQPLLAKPFSFDKIEEAVIAVMRGTPYQPAGRSDSVPR